MNFSEEWSKLTSDRWVLNIVQEGLKLIFKCHPPITGTRITKFQNCVQRQCILDEVDDLLKKSAIEVVPKDQEGLGFYNTFFIVPKKDGGHRPILNLKPLNVYLKNQHFKMETLRSIIQALEQGDWAVSLDLKDAYLHIPMYPPDRQFLRFCIQGKHYQFKAMPFGLATAPRVFTKLMAAVGGFLRTKQIHIFMYLDDWLIKNNIKALVMSHLQQTLAVLIDVGLVVNVKKIATSTVPEDYLLGGRFSPLEGCCSTNSGEIPQFMREYSRFSSGSIYSGSCVPSSSWTHGGLHRFGPYGQTTYAAYPVVPVVAVAPPCGQYSSNDTDKGTSDSSSLVVDSTSEHIQRNVNSVIHSTGNCLDRRLNDGVGSTYEQQNGVWRVVRNHATPSYQHAGDDGSEECFASFPISSAQQTSSNQNGQFNSGDIHKPSRRDAVTQTVHVDMGDPSVVLSEQNIASGGPHTRQEEHFGRRSVQGAASYEDDRKESISEPGRSPLLSVRATEHRSVCNEGQSQSDSVLFPISRSGSMGMRCVGSELDRNVRLCVPPTNSSTKSAKESVAGDLCSTSCCSVLPKTVMAPSIIGASGRISKKSPSVGKHADSAKRTGLSSRSKQSKANRLENFKGHNSPKKFSAKVERYILGSRRQSTRKMYDARFGIYKSWCTSRKISPYKTSVSQVADFLVYLHEDRQCKAGTIAGYRSAIASIHQGWQNSTVSNNADLSKLIKGIFNTSPNIKPLLPNWDLPTVVWALCDFPFEPINSAEMKYVTWKTVFLVALASASRVSEIQALSVGKSHLRYETGGIRLLPNIQFLAKTQRLGKPWTPVFIPEFNQFATDSRDLLLCPCRAIRMYIRRTENIRSVSECLFLTYQPGQSRPASKSTISRWTVSLIKFVYERHNERLDSVRAHDTRRLATSWALFNGASVQEIMQAAHWVNESTFTSFYMRDVPQDDVRFARSSVLETARWAKKHN